VKVWAERIDLGTAPTAYEDVVKEAGEKAEKAKDAAKKWLAGKLI
jgi:hypothetical protein